MMKRLGFLIVIVLIIIYISSYYRYPQTTSILQTSVPQYNHDILLQKQLLVIDDVLANIDIVKEAWFSTNLITNFSMTGSETWNINRYKYMCMYAMTNGELFYFPASKNKHVGPDGAPLDNETVISINISAGQVVIVPRHYRYLIPENMNVQCLGIHDYVSYLLPF
jgi:hypothetical protein